MCGYGWSGGGYGVSQRIKLVHTRSIIDAIHRGTLAKVRAHLHPVFAFNLVPECLGVPSETLMPRNAWRTQRPMISLQRDCSNYPRPLQKYESDLSAT